jgi:hypothetical protein
MFFHCLIISRKVAKAQRKQYVKKTLRLGVFARRIGFPLIPIILNVRAGFVTQRAMPPGYKPGESKENFASLQEE